MSLLPACCKLLHYIWLLYASFIRFILNCVTSKSENLKKTEILPSRTFSLNSALGKSSPRHVTATVANVVNSRRLFIALSDDDCIQRDERDAARRAYPSAAANTCPCSCRECRRIALRFMTDYIHTVIHLHKLNVAFAT